MPRPTAADRDLQALAAHLRKVEAEYTTYFSGRSARPPLESRAALERAFRQQEQSRFDTPALRFQFQTLQARYSSFTDLWDRGVRAREEGRPGPFMRTAPEASGSSAGKEVVVLDTAFSDPAREPDKLHDLYDALMEARRAAGHDVVPFHRFATLVKEQVQSLQERHPGDQVWLRVTRRDGKPHLTARAVKHAGEREQD